MKLVVNIPAYNEERKIAETIRRIPRQIPGIDEVFVQVIDDGSKDKTSEKAREAGADFVHYHKINRGIGIAFRTSVGKALRNEADIMVNIDADGQFDPNDIPKLIRSILDGEADLVSADRFGEYKAKDIPWIKDFLNRLVARIVGKFLNHKINDLTCGFRAYSREALLRLNLSGGFTYTQEVIIDAIGKNLKVTWIPVKVNYFEDRRSRVVKSVWNYINLSSRIILKAVRDVRPMKFFGWPGLILIFISLAIFIYFATMYFQSLKITPYRNHLLLAITFLLVGMQFLIFAFIADMIKTNRKLTEDQMYILRKEKYRKK